MQMNHTYREARSQTLILMQMRRTQIRSGILVHKPCSHMQIALPMHIHGSHAPHLLTLSAVSLSPPGRFAYANEAVHIQGKPRTCISSYANDTMQNCVMACKCAYEYSRTSVRFPLLCTRKPPHEYVNYSQQVPMQSGSQCDMHMQSGS
jgi:hypothetical protein